MLDCAYTICSNGEIDISCTIPSWSPLPNQSCLVLYSFCIDWLYSLIIWLIVSSQSTQKLHLLFCCVLPIPALIWLVIMAWFCAAVRRDSVSLLRFPLFYTSTFSRGRCHLKHPKSWYSDFFLVTSVLFFHHVVCIISDDVNQYPSIHF